MDPRWHAADFSWQPLILGPEGLDQPASDDAPQPPELEPPPPPSNEDQLPDEQDSGEGRL